MTTVLIIAAAWIALTTAFHFTVRPRLERLQLHGDGALALWVWNWIFCHLWHRLKVTGREHIPDKLGDRGLLIVANHTGAVDPMVLQTALPWMVHWMMASEMIIPSLNFVWNNVPVIGVDRDGKDLGPAREAMRRLKGGNSVGIFPEGRIVTPPEQVWPFQPGVGLIVRKTKAPVLLATIQGTPPTNRMLGFLIPSRTRVRFLGLIEYDPSVGAAEIAADLRQRVLDATGWPEGEPGEEVRGQG